MNVPRRILVALALGAGAAALSPSLAQDAPKAAKPEKKKYAVGDTLADAKLTDLSGKEVTLLSLTKGKPAVINFFGRH